MAIEKLTEDEIKVFCSLVTDEQREYCREHAGDPTWPENFLRTCAKDTGEGLILRPLSVEAWWRSIGGGMDGPATVRYCVAEAEILTTPSEWAGLAAATAIH